MGAPRTQALALVVLTCTLPAWRVSAAEPATPARSSLPQLSQRLEATAGQVQSAEESLRFVETQFTLRPEPGEEEARLRRFSDGEILYQLEDWESAAVRFYDLIGDPGFKGNTRYPEALFYLADALYQKKDWVGARLYLKELLARPGAPRYREALARYLEIAGRLNQFAGVEEYLAQAKGQGALPPELAYAYARWFFKRTDLPEAERLRRAREAFTPLAATATPYQRKAAFYLAVLAVQEGDYQAALERFQALVDAPVEDEETRALRELAVLSMGRMLYESGRHDEALDYYARLPQNSESFVDALYELAWVHVKRGAYEQARNATELMLLMAPESPLAPEARILQAHLLLKLQKYAEATGTYEDIIRAYAPVRDQVDALLARNQDAAAWFNQLLARQDKRMDVTSLLPPMAVRYATRQAEVAQAVQMLKDLDNGQQGVSESRAMATRILEALGSRGLQAFPELQEGYTRADAVDGALTRAEQAVLEVESEVLGNSLSEEERLALQQARQEREALRERVDTLPTTQEEVEARRERMQARVEALDKEAYRLGYELQSLAAVSAAVRKWLDDTREERGNTAEEEREFLSQLVAEEQSVESLRDELQRVRNTLAGERRSADAFVSGEEELRTRYRELLAREHTLLAVAESRMGAEPAQVLERAHELRERSAQLRNRTLRAKQALRTLVERRGGTIREKVLVEQQLLQSYEAEGLTLNTQARELTGRVAYDSVRRVRQQFYDLVLKADVGLVDVAFTRKQDKTSEIQRLSSDKDRELRALEEEFREALEDEE